MKDCKGRIIDGKILQIIKLAPGKHPESIPKKERENYYILTDEFFMDGISPELAVPAKFADTCNSAYMGWQQANLTTLDKEAYRPEGQQVEYGLNECGVERYSYSEAGHYDEAMSQVVWFRFVNDQDSFCKRNYGITYNHSSGVKRKLLAAHGFEFSGYRRAKVEHRDFLGFTTEGYGYEIWAHPAGVIVTFEAQGDRAYFSDLNLYVKRRGNHYGKSIGSGSMSYCADKNGQNPGTVICFMSAPVGRYFNIWTIIEQPDIISCWNEGTNGLKHLHLWSYHEAKADPTYSEETFNEIHRDKVRLALNYPLLKHICCG